MFDIREYYDYYPAENNETVGDIDNEIAYDIENLLKNRFEKLYQRDRYRYNENSIDIIYPKLGYPGSPSLISGPDKIRNLLSFYPHKSDLMNVDKIVLRPRFIEIGSIELVSLYLRKKKIIVLYLYHPHYYRVDSSKFSRYREFISIDLEKIMDFKQGTTWSDADRGSDLHIHPLWYILSVISNGNDDIIEKFFIKKENRNQKVYEILNDVSFYYSRHGY